MPTIKELKDTCKSIGIRGYSTLNKTELIDLINNHPHAEKCGICNCNIINKITTQCEHSFCKECINSWCFIHNSCPLCKKEKICPELRTELDIMIDELVKLEFPPTRDILLRLSNLIRENPPRKRAHYINRIKSIMN